MKLLNNKKQQHLMALIYKAQKSAYNNNWLDVTDCLCEIASEVLTLEQLIVLTEKLKNE